MSSLSSRRPRRRRPPPRRATRGGASRRWLPQLFRAPRLRREERTLLDVAMAAWTEPPDARDAPPAALHDSAHAFQAVRAFVRATLPDAPPDARDPAHAFTPGLEGSAWSWRSSSHYYHSLERDFARLPHLPSPEEVLARVDARHAVVRVALLHLLLSAIPPDADTGASGADALRPELRARQRVAVAAAVTLAEAAAAPDAARLARWLARLQHLELHLPDSLYFAPPLAAPPDGLAARLETELCGLEALRLGADTRATHAALQQDLVGRAPLPELRGDDCPFGADDLRPPPPNGTIDWARVAYAARAASRNDARARPPAATPDTRAAIQCLRAAAAAARPMPGGAATATDLVLRCGLQRALAGLAPPVAAAALLTLAHALPARNAIPYLWAAAHDAVAVPWARALADADADAGAGVDAAGIWWSELTSLLRDRLVAPPASL